MKSVRLNGYLREQIVDSVMQEFVKNRLADTGYTTLSALEESRGEARKAAMRKLWDRKYGHFVDALAKVPQELIKRNDFKVALVDNTSQVMCLGEGDKYPGKGTGIDLLLDQDVWDEFFKEYFRLMKMYDECCEAISSYRKEVKSLLDTVNTTKQLVELWPSIEVFLPANIADPDKGIKLPVMAVSRLEERLKGGI